MFSIARFSRHADHTQRKRNGIRRHWLPALVTLSSRMNPGSQRRHHSPVRSVVIGFVITSLLIGAAAYLSTVVLRSNGLYSQHVRWSGSAYRADPVYGYFPKSGATAFHTLKDGERIPVFFDEDGFRVPDPSGAGVHHLVVNSRILFLGGSYTHGYGVRAEDTFAYKTAVRVNARAFNAGGSGWGMSQMLLRARDVIPTLRPEVVIVEYSSRLVRRSTRVYGPTNWGKSPTPYFYYTVDGIHIHRPVFESMNFKLPIWEPEKSGFALFLLRVGIPLFVHDDIMSAVVALRQNIGQIPYPAAATHEIEVYAYNAIRELCDKYGARMLILTIPEYIGDELRHEFKNDVKAPFVETLAPLKTRLPEATMRSWKMHYWLKSPDGRRLLDRHPNGSMHEVIAEILADSIRSISAHDRPVL